ncbi:hypothetical protein C8Q72DRAFT_348848, partial [Fomitopsis betulina]
CAVIAVLSRTGGKGVAHAWQPSCVSIGHLSYISVQLFEQKLHYQSRAVHCSMAHLQTCKFAHLESQFPSPAPEQ